MPEVLECTANLVEALQGNVSKAMKELLEVMLATGLTESLIHTLKTICRVLPDHQALIQQRLLQELTTVLSGRAFEAPGMRGLGRRRLHGDNKMPSYHEPRGGHSDAALMAEDQRAVSDAMLHSKLAALGLVSGSTGPAPVSKETLLLSLKTLASFRMEGVRAPHSCNYLLARLAHIMNGRAPHMFLKIADLHAPSGPGLSGRISQPRLGDRPAGGCACLLPPSRR